MNKIAIIILNWNGYHDTIECLDSLIQSDKLLFDIIVVDNGSKDESVKKIQDWFVEKKLNAETIQAKEIPNQIEKVAQQKNTEALKRMSQLFTLIKSDKNLGFSAGNNLGIQYALQFPYDFIMLLNNDTTVEPNAIQKLYNAMESNTNWGACVPKIKYFDSPDTIWNAGGYLRPLGGRKYLYGNAVDSDAYTGSRHITFATGCALIIRAWIIREHGGLCEDFFFGEEDYELSKRFFNKNIEIYTVLDAVIYHKVGNSRAKLLEKNTFAYDFTHHLNRIIHMKRYMSTFQWKMWRFGGLVYIFLLLTIKKRVPISYKMIKYFRELVNLSNQYSKVDQELFLRSKEILK